MIGAGDVEDLKHVNEVLKKYEMLLGQVMNHPAWQVLLEATENEINAMQPIRPPELEFKAGYVAGLYQVKKLQKQVESKLKMLYDKKENLEELLKENK